MLRIKENAELPKVAQTFVKRPIKIRAMRIYEDFEVETKEGVMRGKPGDYLIKGIEGEVYPCDKAIFDKTYEEVV